MTLKRRDFLKAAGAAAVGLAVSGTAAESLLAAPAPKTRWRGFNLCEKFTLHGNHPFVEQDFEWMAGWGFNFVRLPLDYRCWGPEGSGERALKEIDQAIEFGKRYGIHVNLNLHRAPGYCVNPPKEPLDLWTDPKALDLCAAEWRGLAERYKGIPSGRVSFDLLNEPADCGIENYERVVRRLVKDIREADPARLVMADGYKWGTVPVPALADLGIMQSTRGYAPMEISHHKAPWVGNPQTPPAWPMKITRHWKDKKTNEEKTSVEVWDRQRLIRQNIEPWKELAKKGVGIHVGEFGAYKFTPHPVLLAWMGDNLALWKEAGWGWSMWNFRGTFGILDSQREDIRYESYKGHGLDRQLLELLRQG